MPPDPEKTSGSESLPDGEIYFEFRAIGNAVRVSAIDAGTGTEVVVMGPASAHQHDLEQLALRKLSVALRAGRRS